MANLTSLNINGNESEVVDAYSKTETDDLLANKANANDTYTKTEVDNLIDAIVVDPATDTVYGTVKINPDAGITLNEDGQLDIKGLWGQFEGTTGLYAPSNRDPRAVGNYSVVVTDVKGINLDKSRSLAVVSGLSVTVKRAAPGTTEYHISNTYANRILCQILVDGFAAKDEASSTEETVPVLSVTIDGQPFDPDSSPNDSTKDIIVTTEKTLNPDDTITQIRAVGSMKSYSTVHVGNGIASRGGGRCLLLGSSITKNGSSNEDCVVGQANFVGGNGNAVFGRYHITSKNRGFYAGTGHDGTSAKGESVAVVGQYSLLDANTLFAVGNGTNHVDRSNALELRDDGRLKISGTPSEADDVVTKGYADANYSGGGEISVTTYGNADFTYQQVLDPDTQEVINECVAYSTSAGNANEPTATKYGRIVNLAGAFKNVNVRPDNTAFDMGKVPAGCEPLKTQYILNQGTSQNKFMLTIRPDGTLNCARYSTGASAVAVPNNAWLNINATYVSAT